MPYQRCPSPSAASAPETQGAEQLGEYPTRFREGERLPDDAELYALPSFTPLTDRAQVVQHLADMLDTWPDGERAELSALLVR